MSLRAAAGAVSGKSGVQMPELERKYGAACPRVRSRELLRGGTQLIIEHDGREYRLRVTGNGKLILTA